VPMQGAGRVRARDASESYTDSGILTFDRS
jgi:hypothetical protein